MATGEIAMRNTLFEFIQAQTGIVLNDHRTVELGRYLDRSPHNTYTLLEKLTHSPLDAPLWQDILQLVTVGETYFFRNQAHFSALRYEILPALIAERRQSHNKQLRIWSAGCATGEEPYSLAMLLRELLPDYQDWSLMIMGTDINPQFLARARQGLYSERSFRGETPDYLQSRWFTRRERSFELDPSVRQMVLFSQVNLLHNVYPSYGSNTVNLDLILCRNVTIYFDTSTTQTIINRMYQALNPDGWLIVGHAEPQPGVYDAFKTRNFKNATCYQKAIPAPAPLNYTPPTYDLPAATPVSLPVAPVRPAVAPVAPPLVKVTKPDPKPVPTLAPADEALWAQAQSAANAGDWDEAVELLSMLERRSIMRPQVHYLRALIQQHTEDWNGALASLRQAIYCDPNFVIAHYMLGDLHARRGALKDANRYWRQAQKLITDWAGDMPVIDDLNVDMLRDLLAYRLSAIARD